MKRGFELTNAALLGLANIVLLLVLGLLGGVAGQAGSSTAQGSRDAIRDARGVVVHLATGLLLAARGILVTAGLLERLL